MASPNVLRAINPRHNPTQDTLNRLLGPFKLAAPREASRTKRDRHPSAIAQETVHNRAKILTLEVGEFLQRFLLHVVPRGFMRIHHVGLLANRTRRPTLTRCRALLGQPPIADIPPETARHCCSA